MQTSYLQDPEYFRAFLRRALRKEYVATWVFYLRWICIIGITALCTYVVVQGINTYLYVHSSALIFNRTIQELKMAESAPPPPTNMNSYEIIAEKNIFGSLGPRVVTTPIAAKAQAKLPLILVGTFLAPGETPYAIIENDKKKVQDVFNISDMIFGEAKLTQIFSDKVEILRGGKTEFLTLDDAPDITSSASSNPNSTEFTVEQKELDDALQNLPLLLTQARAVPYFKDGKAVGLRMFSIKSGSMYEKIGLQNGDILKTINGNSLSDISQAMRLFEMLKQERSISVTLDRNREDKEFRYQIR